MHRSGIGLKAALDGIRVAWREEANFKIQIACAVVAVVLGYVLGITKTEWIIVCMLIGFVLTAEAFNTALEEFCDMVKSDPDPHIGKIKDLAAAAVLIASTSAGIVGALIFLPRIFA